MTEYSFTLYENTMDKFFKSCKDAKRGPDKVVFSFIVDHLYHIKNNNEYRKLWSLI